MTLVVIVVTSLQDIRNFIYSFFPKENISGLRVGKLIRKSTVSAICSRSGFPIVGKGIELVLNITGDDYDTLVYNIAFTLVTSMFEAWRENQYFYNSCFVSMLNCYWDQMVLESNGTGIHGVGIGTRSGTGILSVLATQIATFLPLKPIFGWEND